MSITSKPWKAKTFKNIIFLFLLLKMYIAYGQNSTDKKVIVIDPGHGGMDSGAMGIDDVKESEVTLNVAKEILRLNKTLFDGQLDIYMTRYKDTLVSLSDRTKLVKALNADVFISLHCNHSDNTKAKGIEMYAYEKKTLFQKSRFGWGISYRRG
ncbi:N-acetylmuramoyl-L-alanine amidase [Galbibacter sp. EGI 63066]|uniref:N-acetylmuramoyl-L-alanine amidase family protein n=1 Tax=Galbibacter sp. EGI 63066 TaxID=2993559 RepID=UPI0022488E14|nr:N-acetylmuramoyl-L-alanine amidase [Galbibacter sp. EGI 63066]MCX2681886.1 N-acetylmuramoyl-L-alanine amidase [Galbibacter sp. EGI 63066]